MGHEINDMLNNEQYQAEHVALQDKAITTPFEVDPTQRHPISVATGLDTIEYTNHRGDRSVRVIKQHRTFFGAVLPWYPEPRWILLAHDDGIDEDRFFAVDNIHSWNGVPVRGGKNYEQAVVDLTEEQLAILKQRMVEICISTGLEPDYAFPSALQAWTRNIPVMQQSVLMSAIRGMDGLAKRHPAKALIRFYRRSILLSAFDGEAILNPYDPRGERRT